MDIKTEIAELKSRINILEQQLIELPKELPFEIAPKISEKECSWFEAISYCEFLGNGWRLPTFDELTMIYKSGAEGFDDGFYWSSTKYDNYSIRVLDMSTGYPDDINKSYGGFDVRPVRDLVKSKLPFVIAAKAFEIKTDWDSAVKYVKTLGNGWRLPFLNELDLIYNSENDLVNDCYWSDTGSGDYNVWLQNMSNGNQFRASKVNSSYYVRAIRDI